MARKGLGRGLETILGDDREEQPQAGMPATGLRVLSLTEITPDPEQPRKRFTDEALDELAASIRSRGVLQPILVRGDEAAPGRFIIIAGERRWRAAGRAGLHEIPVVVHEGEPGERAEIALIENIQRTDLNPIEEADAYARLRDAFGKKPNDIAEAVGKSRSHVANMLRLQSLHPDIRAYVVEGRLTMGHARALLNADNPLALAEQVIEKGLYERETEQAAAPASRARRPGKGKADAGDPAPAAQTAQSARPKDADTRSLESDLEAALGVSVAVEHGKKGGTVTLTYDTLEQLDDICRRLVGTMI